MSKFFTCPNCGADVPVKALACPSCGSDDETGWSEEAKYVHLLREREEDALPRSQPWRQWGIPVVAAVVLCASLATTGVPVSYLIPALILIAVGYFLFQRRGGLSDIEERRLYTQLLQQTRGDREQAERLIAYEARRNPGASRLQNIRDAIERWERDRR